MPKFVLFPFFLFPVVLFSQQKIKIVDASNNLGIPYAKIYIKGEANYKNSEENGEILLNQKEEITSIEAFGYERLSVTHFQNVFSLKPSFKTIETVEISKPKFSHSFTIGKLKKTNGSFGSLNNQWIVAKEILLEKEFSNPLFIKSVKFLCQSNNNSSKIKLNFYENQDDGLPGELYKSEVVTCKKGRNYTTFVPKKPIVFPKEGLIIGFEWIVCKENEYEMLSHEKDGTKKKVIWTNPSIGATKDENDKSMIIGSLKNGEWKFLNNNDLKGNQITNSILGIELELTD